MLINKRKKDLQVMFQQFDQKYGHGNVSIFFLYLIKNYSRDQLKKLKNQSDILQDFYNYRQAVIQQKTKSLGKLHLNCIEDLVYFNNLHQQSHFISPALGGIVANQAFKFTGKFYPLNQILHYQIASKIVNFIPKELKFDQFYELAEKRVQSLRIVMIGAGASGCQFAKQACALGFSSSQSGIFIIFDDDKIDVSNLNRQFLFNFKDVNKNKAIVCSEKMKLMNRHIKVKAYSKRLQQSTQSHIDWKQIDLIVSAVDGIPARVYLSNLSIKHNIPLIDMGIEKLDGGTQICIPKLTRSLESIVSQQKTNQQQDDHLKLSCTTRSFPRNTAHCILWGKQKFQLIFYQCFDLIKVVSRSNSQDQVDQYLEQLLQKMLVNQLIKISFITRFLSALIINYDEKNLRQFLRFIFNQLYVEEVRGVIKESESKDAEFWDNHTKPIIIKYDPSNQLFQKLEHALKNKIQGVLQSCCIKTLKLRGKKNNLCSDEMIELAKNLDENEIFKNKAKSLSLIKDNIFYTRVNKESIDNINYGEFDKSNDLDIELVKQLTNIRAFQYNIKAVIFISFSDSLFRQKSSKQQRQLADLWLPHSRYFHL